MRLYFCLVALWLGWSGLVQAAPLVEPAHTATQAAAGDELLFQLDYTATTASEAHTTGLALRIHYDSTALQPQSLQAYPQALQAIGTPHDDVADADGAAATDKYWLVAWIDIEATWPGSEQRLDLLQARFQVLADFVGTTAVRVTSVTTRPQTLPDSAMDIQVSAVSKPNPKPNTSTESVAIPSLQFWALVLLTPLLTLLAYTVLPRNQAHRRGKESCWHGK